MSIRIILADDHQIVRDGLRSLIEKEDDMEVIAEAEDGRKAVQLAIKLSPHVVLMDFAMPGLNGIEATRQIIAAAPQIKVIALSMHADKRYIIEMLKAGASGYLLKDSSAFEELVRAIRTTLSNKTYLSPPVSEIIICDYVQQLQKSDGSVFAVLSAREREVLQLLAEGISTAKIADLLCLSVKTVRQGTEEAAKSGSALQEILDQINVVTMQVNQIAAAAEEQSATTSEITNNIHQISEVVRQTAQNSQESTAAAAQLARLSDDLRSLVKRF